MNRLDRALGILLLLRSGKPISATDLARRFEVSTRTIYRDIETLSSVGVPVYAEMGRAGGFRLLEGYFLPPVMFSVREAISLFLGLTLLRSLRTSPFAAEQMTGEQKLLAALPDNLRAILAEAHKLIGFEEPPGDIFHPEPLDSLRRAATHPETEADEGAIVGVFLQAVLERRMVALDYRSPYRAAAQSSTVIPCGVLWDRDRWYLVGRRAGRGEAARMWRADRVLAISASTFPALVDSEFDVRSLLQRSWLRSAMTQWARESPVVIRLSRMQAERLKQDWYYRQARFEELSEDRVVMTFGEDDRDVVLELLRWLGPGAELIEPEAWRAALRAELRQMLAVYAE
jgi:predicted DNA-binding transcriptional regulator YafY